MKRAAAPATPTAEVEQDGNDTEALLPDKKRLRTDSTEKDEGEKAEEEEDTEGEADSEELEDAPLFAESFDVDSLSEAGRVGVLACIESRLEKEEREGDTYFINILTKKRDAALWYRDAEKWLCVVHLWLRANLCDSPLWARMHARPLAVIREVRNNTLWEEQEAVKRAVMKAEGREALYAPPDLDDVYDDLKEGTCIECLVDLADGADRHHLLKVRINEGCADANTGIFGRVWSREGVWATIIGVGVSDSGTAVDATCLALKRYHPFPEHSPLDDDDGKEDMSPADREWLLQYRRPPLAQELPGNLFFNYNENRFEHNAEVEAVLLAIGYLCLRTPPSEFISAIPLSMRQGVTASVLKVIQQRALEYFVQRGEKNPMWPEQLPIELLSNIARFAPAHLPVYDNARFELWKKGVSLSRIRTAESQFREQGVADDVKRDPWTNDWRGDVSSSMALYQAAQRLSRQTAREMLLKTDTDLHIYLDGM